ncbi:MAG: transglycosylase SLT domain-containing protein [Myxococcales bacterium]|nr:transglycosylase SLT domain-containing protein [Myxococcales bacterium]
MPAHPKPRVPSARPCRRHSRTARAARGALCAWLAGTSGGALGGCASAHDHERGNHASGSAEVAGATATEATTASGDGGAPPEAGPATTAAPAPAAPTDWRQPLRVGDFERADELWRALPDAERGRPEMRLAGGAIALGRGRHAEAVSLLQGLESELPLLAAEVTRWYAEAAAVAGPFDAAVAYLARSPLARDLVLAARAAMRGGDARQAKALVDRAVERAERNRREEDEAVARVARAELAEERGDKALALAEWRWLARERPSDPRARDALDALARLGGQLALDDELACIAESSTPQNRADTERRIDALAARPGASKGLVALHRARALHKARDYLAARAAWDAAQPLAGAYAPEARYQAAVAALRGGDDEDALVRLRAVADAGGDYAERAADRVGELLLRMGRYAEAADAFRLRMSRFGRGKGRDDARHGRALALLSSGKPDEARALFAAMRRDMDRLSGGSRLEQAALLELEGVAALRAGHEQEARAIWERVSREELLTYPALVARARLERLGQPVAPAVAPLAYAHTPRVVALPPAVEKLWALGLDAAAESRLAQSEEEAAAAYPGRESEALCAMYEKLAGARRRHQVGSRAVPLEVLMRPPSPADRWAWSCVYPVPYGELVAGEQTRQALPLGLVPAVMRQESAFRANAVSSAGAIGLMQLMPYTAARVAAEAGVASEGLDLGRPELNVRLGAFYVGKLLRTFRGSVPLAVAAYNAGPQAVWHWVRAGSDRELDLWVARIPYDETRAYTARVLGNLARYQFLAGGEAAVTKLPLELPDGVDPGPDAY